MHDLFAGVDRALFAAAFANRLQRSGITTPLSSTIRCAESIALAGPITRDELYWITRLCFVIRHDQIERFDQVFAAVFGGGDDLRELIQRGFDQATSSGDEEHRRRVDVAGEAVEGTGLPWATRPTIVDTGGDDDVDDDENALPELRPSAEGIESDKPFDLLDEAELERVGALLESLLVVPVRRSRRHRRSHSGNRLDLRSTMRRSLRTGGDPLVLDVTTSTERPRRIVVLVDVSGSMESFARAYLHLTRALVVAGHAEVFAFATDLTRITVPLRHRSPVDAIDAASDAVGDRFGGTRLASSLRDLLRHPRWGGFVRGAIVTVVSDGWDTDPPAELAAVMARLSRRAHRVVWVNPRLAAPGYEPLVGAMAAALPHCDAFVSGHSPASMVDVVRAINPDRSRASVTG